MRNPFWTRIKEAWQVLRGDWFIKQRAIYLTLPEKDNKFVQLISWRDTILALDAQGKIWVCSEAYPGSNDFVYQILMESPAGRY